MSRRMELQGLDNAQVVMVGDKSHVPKGTRVHGTRWLDTAKILEDRDRSDVPKGTRVRGTRTASSPQIKVFFL